MPAEGPPPDVPPAAFGRYRVLHQIGAGSLGPVFHGDDSASGEVVAVHVLRLGLRPDLAKRVADGLLHLRTALPAHDAIPPVLDAGVDNGEPYYVTPLVTGDSLDRALERYGPAAIVDAAVRLRQLANALDRAGKAGIWHGALQPHDIYVSAEDTAVVGLGVVALLEREGVPLPARTAYSAPEIADGRGGDAAADQFALATIAHEWLFGRRPDPRLDMPLLPGVSAERLSSAFSGALMPLPAERFQTSGAFVAALSASVRDAQVGPRAETTLLEPQEVEQSVEPEPVGPGAGEISAGDLPFAELDLDPDRPIASAATPVMWQGALSAAEPVRERPGGYGTGTIVTALFVGLALGIVSGYWLGARAGSVRDAAAAVGQEFTDAAAPAKQPEPPRADEPPVVPAVREATVERPGRLLVRTVPAGARVTVDGVERGETPLALRDLELGTHTVSIARAGSAAVERSVTLTADRPSRTLEEALRASAPAPVAPKREREPERAKAARSGVGSVFIASRPAGATVTIDGRPAGTTPLTVPSLGVGSHTVRITRPGYRPWTTSVEISEGVRARVAASLVGGQTQE